MEINSNSRNKPTADWISNKNAIASNNVSFVSNVVRCFHWLCWLLKNTFPSRACYFLRHFACCFYSSSFLPTVYCQRDDLWPAGQPITAVVFHQTRGLYQRVQGGEFDPRFSIAFLREKKMPAPCYFYITAAYDLYAFLVWGYCCAMLPVLSVLLDVTVI